MPVWTAVVGDIPTCTFAAEDKITAESFVEDEVFQSELIVHENVDGHPLWDEAAHISVRLSTPKEYRNWRLAHTDTQDEEASSNFVMEAPEDSNEWVVFLIPIRDPADE